MSSIVFASGKGGVGKSSICLNLALVLAKSGKKIVIVDADMAMANIGLMLGVERTPITLNHVLSGENAIEDAVYDGPWGLRYVPSELSVEKLSSVDFSKLRDAILQLEKSYDYVFIDPAPGWMPDAKAAMDAASEAYVILTPEPPAMADGLKVKNYLERKGTRLNGAILNMVMNDPVEVKPKEVETLLGIKVAAVLPEDRAVRKASASQSPIALQSPHSPFMLALTRLAGQITGHAVALPETKVKKGILQSIVEFFRNLFAKKNKAAAGPK
ncbi:AAA family ATPase [Candidatus Micrarchaeota archaeon]|nr:AAA family ATPase [Candidatus Micrarchaeota archaeon]